MIEIMGTSTRTTLLAAGILLGGTWAGAAFAAETVIGQPVTKHGMNIKTIYIQAVDVEHGHHGGHHGQHELAEQKDRVDSDMHLEARIHAAEKNPHGFPAGSWIPYLKIEYKIVKEGSEWKSSGFLEPMAANDGPHYGDNVKLDGAGKYVMTLRINPPGIPNHADKETGIGGWWEPFDVEMAFPFFGTGKKGGY